MYGISTHLYATFQGNQYNVWKLTDLQNCDELVHFYLFKDVNKALWKTSLGSVVGILNPTIMKSAEKVARIFICVCS